MSEPTQGPYVAVQLGELWEVCNRENTIICTVWELGGAEHTAHLLAASWEMREALERTLTRIASMHDRGSWVDAKELGEIATDIRAALAASRGEAKS